MSQLSVFVTRPGKPFVFPPRSTFEPSAAQAVGRRRLWDLSSHLHCSVIGTCLSAGDLRRIVVKIHGELARAWNDHEIHKEGVAMAHARSGSAKLLHKALDERHSAAIHRFEAASTSAEVVAMWRDAREEGEIPGAYWASVTHPHLTEQDLHIIFGDVHMLSHLVGAANRADIRRLAALEAENVELRGKIERLQARIAREAQARAAESVRLARLEATLREAPAAAAAIDTDFAELAERLQRRLDRESARRAALEEQATALRMEMHKAREEAEGVRKAARRCQEDITVLERLLAGQSKKGDTPNASALAGCALLYVGGRTHLRAALTAAAARVGATLNLHDGGLEETGTTLPRLVAQADHVFFPVDCVSHDAVGAVKRACRQTDTTYTPLSSSGLGSFARRLHELAAARAADVA